MPVEKFRSVIGHRSISDLIGPSRLAASGTTHAKETCWRGHLFPVLSGTLHRLACCLPRRGLMDRKRSASEVAIIEHVQQKLGEAIRSQYELAQPLPDGLYRLVMELDRRSS